MFYVNHNKSGMIDDNVIRDNDQLKLVYSSWAELAFSASAFLANNAGCLRAHS